MDIQTVQNTFIVLYDDECAFCSAVVQWIINRDPQGKFKFAALRSQKGKSLLNSHLEKPPLFDSFVLIHKQHVFTQSTAALYLLKEMGNKYNWLFILILVPEVIRDFVYDRVAKNRHRFMSRNASCWLPTPEIKNRFLDAGFEESKDI